MELYACLNHLDHHAQQKISSTVRSSVSKDLQNLEFLVIFSEFLFDFFALFRPSIIRLRMAHPGSRHCAFPGHNAYEFCSTWNPDPNAIFDSFECNIAANSFWFFGRFPLRPMCVSCASCFWNMLNLMLGTSCDFEILLHFWSVLEESISRPHRSPQVWSRMFSSRPRPRIFFLPKKNLLWWSCTRA